MKKNINIIPTSLRVLLILGCFSAFLSCKKENEGEIVNKGEVILNVNASFTNLSDGEIISSKKASIHSNSEKLINTLELDNGFSLVAELSPASENTAPIVRSSSLTNEIGNRGSTEIRKDIWYKLIVFDAGTKAYIAERDYKHLKEYETPVLRLDGGKTYTFIAYSMNSESQADLNIINAPATGQTIGNTKINLSGSKDFLFFKKDYKISGESVDYLNILFKHKFNEITTKIETDEANDNLSNIVAHFTGINKSATMFLADEVIYWNSDKHSISPVFSSNGNSATASTPIIAESGAVSLTLSKYTIGTTTNDRTNNPHTLFSNITLVPGVKYNLLIKIVGGDKFLIHKGQKAARINGQIWMRHNLGSNYSAEPDVTSANTMGSYFQFGRSAAFMTGTSTATSGWIGTVTSTTNYSWNTTGSEYNPTKNTSLDPCPVGYRVPTQTEYLTLIGNTTHEWTGSTSTSYNRAGRFKSKRKTSVFLTLPAQGGSSANGLPNGTNFTYIAATHRNNVVIYWTSSRTSHPNTFAMFYNPARATPYTYGALVSPSGDGGPNNAAPLAGLPIRCIAE